MRSRSRFCYAEEGQNRLCYDNFFDIRTIHKEPIYRAFLFFRFGSNDKQLLSDQHLVLVLSLEWFFMDPL